MTLLMKAFTAGFLLGVPTFIVGNAHGVPECTPLAASERSQVAAPAAGVPLAALSEGFEGATFPPPGWTTKSAGLPLPHAWHRTADPDNIATGTAAAYVGSGSPSAIDEWLITPAVTLGATDKAINSTVRQYFIDCSPGELRRDCSTGPEHRCPQRDIADVPVLRKS